jgi:DNA helicase-2/ATP-dependent DNA helicase PcrA
MNGQEVNTPINIDQVLERQLTPEQRAAATDTSREVLCLACAGSGKSRTLAYRIASVLSAGEPAEGIVAFTFTEKAAEMIKRRVSQALTMVGVNPAVMGAMYIGTIHSYCQNILGRMDAVYRQFDVLDENRLKLYIISRGSEIGLAAFRPRARGNSYFDAVKQLSDAWKTLNDEMLTIPAVLAEDAQLGEGLTRLRDCLRRDQYIDFSLMIRLVVDALVRGDGGARAAVSQLRHLMVDEYQDVSPSQEELVRRLHELSESVFVVGDDDQSIYAWRGADVSNILSFRARYPGAAQLPLSQNFRSTSAIVQASDGFVAAELGPSRIAKNPTAAYNRTPRQFGVLWFNNRNEEAQWVASRIEALLGTAYGEADGNVRGLTPADFAILMRSTRQPEPDRSPRHSAYTQALANRNIFFSLEAGGGPFDRPQVSVLRSTFELLRNASPTRQEVQGHFNQQVVPAYPAADFNALARVLTEWGRLIHTPPGGARRRVYPQQLVYDLLDAFGLARSPLSDAVMRDIGLFSFMIQDVEAVYMSVDSPSRFREILNFLNNAAETGYDVSTEDVLQRPDEVTVSTVHKAKGLEYPVVFVVDVESQRFPGNRRGYEGWLPAGVIQPAITRGAYQKSRNEEARLFYTAITRAERYLYVTGAENLPGGARPRSTSEFARRLVHPEISADPTQLPVGVLQSPPRRRIDETVLPTSFSQIRYYLRCPMDYRFREGFGFTPPIPEMFGFGKTVHTAVEKLHENYDAAAPSRDEAADMARQVFHLKHVPKSRDPVNNPGPYERARDTAVRIVETYADSYAPDFERRRQVEARFEIPARDCVISGAIDLLLREDEGGRVLDAEVIDFKAIEGGDDPARNVDLDWTEFSLQVQLYARAAQEVLGENARTGSVHLLKDGQRIEVPVTEEAVRAAVENVEWAVRGILAADFPMRPHPEKCAACDFNRLCPRSAQPFLFSAVPPPAIYVPTGRELPRAFSRFEP